MRRQFGTENTWKLDVHGWKAAHNPDSSCRQAFILPQRLYLILEFLQLALIAPWTVPQLVHAGIVVYAPAPVGELERAQALFRKPYVRGVSMGNGRTKASTWKLVGLVRKAYAFVKLSYSPYDCCVGMEHANG